MPWKDKATLKNFFKNGNNPTEAHFGHLIDSTINKIDDGFAKNVEDGLQLSPMGNSNKLISFYEDVRDANANWQIGINPDEKAKGLAFTDSNGKSRLFLGNNGKVGVQTPYPRTTLDVRGTSTLSTRIGGYLIGKAPADGKWHVVMEKLTGCHAFEIVANARGVSDRGQYAMAHAIAVSAFGARSKINVTQSYCGFFWNKILFRWRGEPKNYRLEIRTRTSYSKNKDKPIHINYHVGKLWDDNMFYKESDEALKSKESKKS